MEISRRGFLGRVASTAVALVIAPMLAKADAACRFLTGRGAKHVEIAGQTIRSSRINYLTRDAETVVIRRCHIQIDEEWVHAIRPRTSLLVTHCYIYNAPGYESPALPVANYNAGCDLVAGTGKGYNFLEV